MHVTSSECGVLDSFEDDLHKGVDLFPQVDCQVCQELCCTKEIRVPAQAGPSPPHEYEQATIGAGNKNPLLPDKHTTFSCRLA